MIGAEGVTIVTTATLGLLLPLVGLFEDKEVVVEFELEFVVVVEFFHELALFTIKLFSLACSCSKSKRGFLLLGDICFGLLLLMWL